MPFLILLVEVDFAPFKGVELGVLRFRIIALGNPMTLHSSVIGEGLAATSTSIAVATTMATSATRGQ